MIKKIPIKGISRSPSEQVGYDGACIDSLNIQLDKSEAAPVMQPVDAKSRFEKLTNGVVLSDDAITDATILYIHKGLDYENLIVVQHYYPQQGYPSHTLKAYSKVYGGMTIMSLSSVIKDVIAVGNTLVVTMLNEKKYYILWKGGEYQYLGDHIPVPDISFRTDTIREDADFYVTYQGEYIPAPQVLPETTADYYAWGKFWKGAAPEDIGFNNIPDLPIIVYHRHIDSDNSALSQDWGGISTKYKTQNTEQQEILDNILGKIDAQTRSEINQGKLCHPVFLRFAVRLYDGTRIDQSVPFLLGAEVSHFSKILLYTVTNRSNDGLTITGTTYVAATAVSKPYAVNMVINSLSTIYDGWDDIVAGVDIFSSPQFDVRRDRIKLSLLDSRNTQTGGTPSTPIDEELSLCELDPEYTELNQEEWVRQYQTTYLIKSFSPDEFADAAGSAIVLDDINFSADWITNQEALKETPGSIHEIVAGNLFKYNNRLMVTGGKQVLSSGPKHFPSSAGWTTNPSGLSYTFYYYLRGTNGESIVESEIITAQHALVDLEYMDEKLGPWIAYPDSRCYKVVIVRNYSVSPGYLVVHMKAATQIDVAYAFFGFGEFLWNQFTSGSPGTITEKNEYPLDNTIVVSDVNNPFVFRTSNWITFAAGEIISLASATTPLSEGQFGQFPIYAFTDEGVFAISVDNEGNFRTTHAVSRDIILNKDAVTGIEQGVFFAAARGLLLLQGSTVTLISGPMEGKAVNLSNNLRSLLESSFFEDYGLPEADDFHAFLEGCGMLYEYANKRIVLFRHDLAYQYVYKIDTKTWHRHNGIGAGADKALNSYPEALLIFETAPAHETIYDLSVIEETSGATPLPGLVYTGGLDLDNADVYKTINRLKVRGNYNGSVNWILQGSNDGRTYYDLHSLRGPAWKWYRIILVTSLEVGDRISYIELDYTPKFTNKIR